MSDDKPPLPDQPTTKQVPREDILQAQVSLLLTRVTEGFGKVETLSDNVTKLTANVEIVSNDLGIVKDRVSILETERTKLSGGVRGLSTSDAGQNMQIASLAVKVDALTASQDLQLTILSRLDKVASNPLVKTMGAMLATAVITWLASHGVNVK